MTVPESRLRQPRAMLFDLDGTLADTAHDLAAAVNAMRTERGMAPLPVSALRGYASMGARGLIGAGMGVGPDAPEFPAMRDEFIERYEAAMLVHTRLFDGMAEVLDALDDAGMRWGVVSNKIERFVRPIIAYLGLAERCGCAIGGDTTPTPKPHPAPLLLAARQIDVDPVECIYVGDDLRDIQAGRAAGMQTVAAAYGYCGDDPPATQWQADRVVDSVAELLTLIR